MLKKITAALFCLLTAAQTYAGGVILYEIGTPDLGLATAGWAARAEVRERYLPILPA